MKKIILIAFLLLKINATSQTKEKPIEKGQIFELAMYDENDPFADKIVWKVKIVAVSGEYVKWVLISSNDSQGSGYSVSEKITWFKSKIKRHASQKK